MVPKQRPLCWGVLMGTVFSAELGRSGSKIACFIFFSKTGPLFPLFTLF